MYRSTLKELFDNAEFDGVVARVPQYLTLSEEDRQVLTESLAALELQRQLMEPPGEAQVPIHARKVLCILHGSLPQQTGGYAMRAHGILSALSPSWDIHCVTRPGFPDNQAASSDCDHVDGIAYHRLSEVIYPRKHGEMRYMLACVARYEEVMRRVRPAVVHLRSTYLVALPGLIAARRLGIPTVYEVSGFWELVYAGRRHQGGMTGRETRTIWSETLVAKIVDRSVTLTTRMRDILIERGAKSSSVLLSPNAVHASDFERRVAARRIYHEYGLDEEVPTIGYLGTFVDYEGLDLLIRSFELLRAENVDFQAILVGDGADFHRIQTQVQAAGLSDRVVLTGRRPHSEIAEIYTIIDICAFPRRSTPATEAVSPLKPFEALASSKAVIVSPVSALKDIVEDRRNGLVMRDHSETELSRLLKILITDRELRTELAERGRQLVASEYSWDRAVQPIARWYQELSDAEYVRCQSI